MPYAPGLELWAKDTKLQVDYFNKAGNVAGACTETVVKWVIFCDPVDFRVSWND